MSPCTPRSLFRCRLAGAMLLLFAASAHAVSIGQVLNDPRTYADKTVTVEGQVVGMLSLFVIKYFTLNDGTGSINVITEKPLPKKGQRIRVTGKVSELFSLGRETLLVLMEQDKDRGKPGTEETGAPESREQRLPGAI